MRRYFARIEELTNRIAAEQLPVTAPYTPEVVAELGGLLDAAQRAAENDTIRHRVQFLRRGLQFAALQQRASELVDQAGEQRVSAELKAALHALQQEKWLLMRHIFHEDYLAVNVAMVAWGGEGRFRRFGWSGVKSVPKGKSKPTKKAGRSLTFPLSCYVENTWVSTGH